MYHNRLDEYNKVCTPVMPEKHLCDMCALSTLLDGIGASVADGDSAFMTLTDLHHVLIAIYTPKTNLLLTVQVDVTSRNTTSPSSMCSNTVCTTAKLLTTKLLRDS